MSDLSVPRTLRHRHWKTNRSWKLYADNVETRCQKLLLRRVLFEASAAVPMRRTVDENKQTSAMRTLQADGLCCLCPNA